MVPVPLSHKSQLDEGLNAWKRKYIFLILLHSYFSRLYERAFFNVGLFYVQKDFI